MTSPDGDRRPSVLVLRETSAASGPAFLPSYRQHVTSFSGGGAPGDQHRPGRVRTSKVSRETQTRSLPSVNGNPSHDLRLRERDALIRSASVHWQERTGGSVFLSAVTACAPYPLVILARARNLIPLRAIPLRRRPRSTWNLAEHLRSVG